MENLSETISTFLEEEGFCYEEFDEGPRFKIYFDGNEASFNSLIYIDEDERKVSVRSLSPIYVPHAKKRDVGELLVRMNLGLLLGKFSLDMEDRTILFKTGLVFSQMQREQKLLIELITYNLIASDYCFPVIASVIYGNVSPKEAAVAF